MAAMSFKGKCWSCNKPGHWATECPQKGKMTCTVCGKKGHTSDHCWNLEKNAGKRPAWYHKMQEEHKARKEMGNMAVDEHITFVM